MQQALQGPPAGVPFCSAYQELRWPSSLGPFSVFSCRCQGTPGEREATVMASLPARDSAVLPCLHGCRPLVHRGLPRVPQAISLQSGADSSQPLCAPGDLHPCPGYVGPRPRLSVWLSLHSITGQLWHSPAASDAGSLSQTVALLWGSDPCFSSLTLWVQVQSCSLSLFLSFLL